MEYPGRYNDGLRLESIVVGESKSQPNSTRPAVCSNIVSLDHLGLGAHSIHFLDGILTAIRSTNNSKESKLAELTKLESEIREFLGILMGSLNWTDTLKCVHVALCTRSGSLYLANIVS